MNDFVFPYNKLFVMAPYMFIVSLIKIDIYFN